MNFISAVPGPSGRDEAILKRSSIINALLAVAIGVVGLKIYEIWQQDDWRQLKTRDHRPPVTDPMANGGSAREHVPKTDAIVERNLFDVRRGSGGTASSTDSTEGTGIEGIVLLGTVVTDGEQFAIVKVPPEASVSIGRPGAGAGVTMKRLALGDVVGGYELVEIQSEKIVLKKGAAEVELGLDFTRNNITVQPSGTPARTKAQRPRPAGKSR
jgi:hypothetical protein